MPQLCRAVYRTCGAQRSQSGLSKVKIILPPISHIPFLPPRLSNGAGVTFSLFKSPTAKRCSGDDGRKRIIMGAKGAWYYYMTADRTEDALFPPNLAPTDVLSLPLCSLLCSGPWGWRP